MEELSFVDEDCVYFNWCGFCAESSLCILLRIVSALYLTGEVYTNYTSWKVEV